MTGLMKKQSEIQFALIYKSSYPLHFSVGNIDMLGVS